MKNQFWIIATAFIFMCAGCGYAGQTLMAGFEYMMIRQADSDYIKDVESTRHASAMNKVSETVALATVNAKIQSRKNRIILITQTINVLSWLLISLFGLLALIVLWRFNQWSYLHAHKVYPNKNGDWPIVMMNGRVHILDAGISYDEAEVRKIEPLLLQARTAVRLNVNEVRLIEGNK